MKKRIEQILNKPAWRHLASGDFWACDVCSAMGKCSCKIKDMKADKIAEAITSELKKDYALAIASAILKAQEAIRKDLSV